MFPEDGIMYCLPGLLTFVFLIITAATSRAYSNPVNYWYFCNLILLIFLAPWDSAQGVF